MMFKGKKEEEVFELLKERWPDDVIVHQYRVNTRYNFKEMLTKRMGEKAYIRTIKRKFIVVDFLNFTKNIVIEVDDTSHENSKAQDKAKDRVLKRKGFKVIRIPYDVGFIEGTKKLLNENQDT